MIAKEEVQNRIAMALLQFNAIASAKIAVALRDADLLEYQDIVDLHNWVTDKTNGFELSDSGDLWELADILDGGIYTNAMRDKNGGEKPS